jgi:predicted O-methyltransferase YrrM
VENLKQFIGDSHSQEARQFLASNLVEPLDVAFIDGDHSYEGVWADIRVAMAFSRPGTIFIFHDTVACEGVERAWLEVLQGGLVKGLAEYVGEDKPLGIGVGALR